MGKSRIKFDLSDVVQAFRTACTGYKPRNTVFGQYRIEGTGTDARLIYRANSSEEVRRPYGAEAFKQWRINTAKRLRDLDGTLISMQPQPGLRVKSEVPVMLEALTYDTVPSGMRIQYTETDTVAAQTAHGLIFYNSSILPLIGRTVSYGNVSHNRTEVEIQRICERSGLPGYPLDMLPEFERSELLVGSQHSVEILYRTPTHTFMHSREHRQTLRLPRTDLNTVREFKEALRPDSPNGEPWHAVASALPNLFATPQTPTLPTFTEAERIAYLASDTYGLTGDDIAHLFPGYYRPNSRSLNAEIECNIPRVRNVDAHLGKSAGGAPLKDCVIQDQTVFAINAEGIWCRVVVGKGEVCA